MAKPLPGRALLAGLGLALTGALCSFLILNFKFQTADLIAANQKNRLDAMVSKMLPLNPQNNLELDCRLFSDPKIGNGMRLLRAFENGEFKGTILTFTSTKGYASPLILIGGFDTAGRIYRIDIALSNETPGLGDKVDYDHGQFLDALSGLGIDDAVFDVTKFGGDFDYITGATVTSRAIILAAYDALKALEGLDAVSLPKCRREIP